MKLVAGGVPERLPACPVGANAAEGPNSVSNALGVGPEELAPCAEGLMDRSVAPSLLGFLKNGLVELIPLGLARLDPGVGLATRSAV